MGLINFLFGQHETPIKQLITHLATVDPSTDTYIAMNLADALYRGWLSNHNDPESKEFYREVMLSVFDLFRYEDDVFSCSDFTPDKYNSTLYLHKSSNDRVIGSNNMILKIDKGTNKITWYIASEACRDLIREHLINVIDKYASNPSAEELYCKKLHNKLKRENIL